MKIFSYNNGNNIKIKVRSEQQDIHNVYFEWWRTLLNGFAVIFLCIIGKEKLFVSFIYIIFITEEEVSITDTLNINFIYYLFFFSGV